MEIIVLKRRQRFILNSSNYLRELFSILSGIIIGYYEYIL